MVAKNSSSAASTHRAIAAIDRDVAVVEERLTKIRSVISQLNDEARQAEARLKHLRDARRSLNLAGTDPEGQSSSIEELPEAPVGFAKRRIERPDSQAWQVRQQAYRILKDQGHPLSRNEIFDRFSELGIEIDHPEPEKRLGRILTDAEEFEYRDNGYWPKGEPITVLVERKKRNRRRRKSKEM